jgi:hypothetical protein
MGNKMSAPPRHTLRILCLGDSLTAGYSCYGMVFSPYSTTFKESLVRLLDSEDYREKNKGRGPRIEVVTDGKSGDLVSAGGTFEERMRSRCPSPCYHYKPSFLFFDINCKVR